MTAATTVLGVHSAGATRPQAVLPAHGLSPPPKHLPHTARPARCEVPHWCGALDERFTSGYLPPGTCIISGGTVVTANQTQAGALVQVSPAGWLLFVALLLPHQGWRGCRCIKAPPLCQGVTFTRFGPAAEPQQ